MKSAGDLMEWNRGVVSDGVLEIQANSWRGFVEYFQEQSSDCGGYIYRGQREEWPLRSKVHRVIDDLKRKGTIQNNDLARLSRQERVLEDFKQACRGRRGAFPSELRDNTDWWALGQHYGLETPLLDWTESPFVAAFFAFAEAKSEECSYSPRMVYGIHRRQVESKWQSIIQNPPSSVADLEGIEIISPQVDDNSRLVSQRALCTMSLRIGHEVESWVRNHFAGIGDPIMIKISIKEQSGDREDFLKFLNRMNINYLTLFPDLEGAARYCNMRLEIDGY